MPDLEVHNAPVVAVGHRLVGVVKVVKVDRLDDLLVDVGHVPAAVVLLHLDPDVPRRVEDVKPVHAAPPAAAAHAARLVHEAAAVEVVALPAKHLLVDDGHGHAGGVAPDGEAKQRHLHRGDDELEKEEPEVAPHPDEVLDDQRPEAVPPEKVSADAAAGRLPPPERVGHRLVLQGPVWVDEVLDDAVPLGHNHHPPVLRGGRRHRPGLEVVRAVPAGRVLVAAVDAEAEEHVLEVGEPVLDDELLRRVLCQQPAASHHSDPEG